ncbi:MAG: hypothetical protein JWP91_2044 [Fibrobacteres bacterium]|nr:hypothetical protein [Fibrobacterota bacterium]
MRAGLWLAGYTLWVGKDREDGSSISIKAPGFPVWKDAPMS